MVEVFWALGCEVLSFSLSIVVAFDLVESHLNGTLQGILKSEEQCLAGATRSGCIGKEAE